CSKLGAYAGENLFRFFASESNASPALHASNETLQETERMGGIFFGQSDSDDHAAFALRTVVADMLGGIEQLALGQRVVLQTTGEVCGRMLIRDRQCNIRYDASLLFAEVLDARPSFLVPITQAIPQGDQG